jgi:hypothetical protein
LDGAGYLKIVFALAVEPLGPAASQPRTETQVATTEPSPDGRSRN